MFAIPIIKAATDNGLQITVLGWVSFCMVRYDRGSFCTSFFHLKIFFGLSFLAMFLHIGFPLRYGEN